MKNSKTAKKSVKRVSHLSKKQIHKIYSAAASKAWITIYQNKIAKTRDASKKKEFRVRLAELRAA